MADETGLDFSDQINMLENKYQQVCLKIIDFLSFYIFVIILEENESP